MQIHHDARFQALIERMEALHLEGSIHEMQTTLEQLQTLAEIEQDNIGLAASYFYRDILSEDEPSDEGYMRYARRALRVSIAKNIPYYEMKASNSLGISFSVLSDFHTSLEHYLRAIHIAEEHPEFCYSSVVLNNVGNLFVWLEEYVEAANYLERAYEKSVTENQKDQALISLIVLNLVELYSNTENYVKVEDWKSRSYNFLSQEFKDVLMCIDLINNARQLTRNGHIDMVKDEIYDFLEKTSELTDYIYIFHCFVKAIRLGIQLNDFSMSQKLMARLENLQEKSTMASFAYDYATVRIEYYRAFHNKLDNDCHAFFEEYFQLSQNRITQLRNTYARSLSVKIALEEARDENKTVHLQNEQLQKDIERDIFTNLYNKVSTEKYIRIALMKRAPGTVQGFMLIDIDLFKRINDNYGHGFGDNVISQVSGALDSLDVGPKVVGRFGGDEFLVFLADQPDAQSVCRIAEELLARARSNILLPDTRVDMVTLSIGICIIDSFTDFETAFTEADKALYRAKELGRNRYELSS